MFQNFFYIYENIVQSVLCINVSRDAVIHDLNANIIKKLKSLPITLAYYIFSLYIDKPLKEYPPNTSLKFRLQYSDIYDITAYQTGK